MPVDPDFVSLSNVSPLNTMKGVKLKAAEARHTQATEAVQANAASDVQGEALHAVEASQGLEAGEADSSSVDLRQVSICKRDKGIMIVIEQERL